MVALLEGFEVETVHAGALGRGGAGVARVGVAPRLIMREDEAPIAAATVVDGRAWSGDVDAVSELGLALAHAVAAARARATGVVVRLALGNDFLLQIAKLRAARALWARVSEVARECPPMIVWAEPSAWGWTAYDPWVNLLRNTAGTFAAIVGGADWVTPRAWDAALGEPDAQALRLAENTFHLLVHEGHVAWPADPAAGSWALEAWTGELAARAWAVAQDIERAGGAAAVDAHALGATTRATRRERIVKRLDGIVGTSMFPNVDEARPARSGPGLDRLRAAAPFERLRAACQAVEPRPSAFLACLGPLAEHSARAMWTKGLYEVAGLRVTQSPPIVSSSGDGEDGARVAAAAVDAWRASLAPLAVVCGSDEAYARDALTVLAALKQAGARVVLAGRPKGMRFADGALDGQVYLGIDVVATLEAELRAQGVDV